MDISHIYIHDAKLLKVIEDTETDTLTMECELPVDDWSDEFKPGLLIFDNVLNYRVCEIAFHGRPALLDINIVGEREGRSRVRLETNAGWRELDCTAVRIIMSED